MSELRHAEPADNLFCEQCGYDFTTGQAPPQARRPSSRRAEPRSTLELDRQVGRRRRGRSGLVRLEGLAGRSAVPAGVVVDRRARAAHHADRPVQPVARHPSGDRTGRRHRRVPPARPVRARRRRSGVVDLSSTNGTYVVPAGTGPTEDTHAVEAGRADAAARRRPGLRRRMEPAHRPPRLSRKEFPWQTYHRWSLAGSS